MRRHLLVAAVAAAMCAVCADGAVRTWKGGSGKWSVAANWQEGEAPQNGDSLVIYAEAGIIELENDIPGLSLDKITISTNNFEEAPVVLSGEKLSLTNTATAIESYCHFTNSMPLVFASAADPLSKQSVRAHLGCAFLGDVELLGNFNVWTIASKNVMFLDRVHGDDAYLCTSLANNSLRFYAPVEVKGLLNTGYWCNCQLIFYSAGNKWETNCVAYSTAIQAAANYAFPTNMVFRWKESLDASYPTSEGAAYYLSGNQVIDRIESLPPIISDGTMLNKFYVQFYGNAVRTLTMRATASAECYAIMKGMLGIVYDPVGDYVQTFNDRTQTISGGITVRRGTLESSGANTFASVTSLEVLPGARFKVSASDYNEACNPFPGGVTMGTVHAGGVLEVCGGVTLTLKTLRAEGASAPVGTYQAMSGTDPDAVKVSWIEGGGLVSVAAVENVTCWKDPVDGDWDDATKWTDGVPTLGRLAYVTAEGAEYTVTVPAGTALPTNITVGSMSGKSRVSFGSGRHSTDGWTWTLDEGGVIEVPSGAEVVCDGKMIQNNLGANVLVNGGGEFLVSGGDIVFTNAYTADSYYGFRLGGSESLTGRLTVTSGSFRYVPYKSSRFRLDTYGLVELKGGLIHIPTMTTWANQVFMHEGGQVVATGGEFRTAGGTRNGWPTFVEEGAVFSGDSVFRFRTDDYLNVRAKSGGTAKLEFRGSSGWIGRCNIVTINSVPGGRGVLLFDSDTPLAQGSYISYHVMAGCDEGFGEMEVLSGYVPAGARGINVACASAATKTTDGVEGFLKVSGGALYVHGATDNNGWDSNRLLGGVVVGDGGYTAVRDGHPYVGRLEMTGGVITNKNGITIVGLGYGKGSFVVSNGLYYAYNVSPVVVGMGGGIGSLEVAGGSFVMNSQYADLYVGGVATNSIISTYKVPVNLVSVGGYPIHHHDAQGRFTFSGGTATVKGKVVLGADGEGTLERVGTNGTFTIAKDLVFSNTVENVDSGGTFAVDFADHGSAAPVSVAGKVVVGANAKLEVDTGDVALKRVRCKILTAAQGVTGDFAPENVTFTGVNAKAMKHYWTADGSLFVFKNSGTTLYFR